MRTSDSLNIEQNIDKWWISLYVYLSNLMEMQLTALPFIHVLIDKGLGNSYYGSDIFK